MRTDDVPRGHFVVVLLADLEVGLLGRPPQSRDRDARAIQKMASGIRCHPGASRIVLIGDRGAAVMCGECWPGAKDRCPTCGAFGGPKDDAPAGVAGICARCGVGMVLGCDGLQHGLDDRLMNIADPSLAHIAEYMRDRIVEPAGQA